MNYSLLCKLLDGTVMKEKENKGRFVTDFLNNMTESYNLESIKKNIESLKAENKLIFKVANNYKFIYAALAVVFIVYWLYWSFFTALFSVGIALIAIVFIENDVDKLAGYSDETIRLMNIYMECESRDEKAKENK